MCLMMNEKCMKNLYTLLSRKTDPKARRPNKMTSSETHKNKKVIIGDDFIPGWCCDYGRRL